MNDHGIRNQKVITNISENHVRIPTNPVAPEVPKIINVPRVTEKVLKNKLYKIEFEKPELNTDLYVKILDADFPSNKSFITKD